LPEMGRSLGKGMREFKDGVTGHAPPEVDTGSNSSRTELAEPVAKGEGS
jgi:Sec-independent protein translocase protein TatA